MIYIYVIQNNFVGAVLFYDGLSFVQSCWPMYHTDHGDGFGVSCLLHHNLAIAVGPLILVS